MEHIDDNTPVPIGEFSDHLKDFEKLEEMVFEHEDLLSKLVRALLGEENLSIGARELIKSAYDDMFGKK